MKYKYLVKESLPEGDIIEIEADSETEAEENLLCYFSLLPNDSPEDEE